MIILISIALTPAIKAKEFAARATGAKAEKRTELVTNDTNKTIDTIGGNFI